MDKDSILLDDLRNKIKEQESQIINLQEELLKKEEKLDSFSRLITTSVGLCTSNHKIIYRNWWPADPDSLWFTHFIKHKFPDADYELNFFSVLTVPDFIKFDLPGKKILYSGENLNKKYLFLNEKFGRYALDYVDFAMGFDLLDHPKYLRLPLWLIWFFSPYSTPEDIENQINNWNNLHFEKSKNVALISSHDNWKSRSLIADDIENIVNIDYAGRWRNNTSELKDKYDDRKAEYLKQFKFNICPENVMDTGYVTEKLFDAISCDCIPLYAGGGDYMEPEVLNDKAILKWDFNKDNSDVVELFKTLISDEKSYNDFKNQNVVLDSSVKFISNKFSKLEKHLEKIIYD